MKTKFGVSLSWVVTANELKEKKNASSYQQVINWKIWFACLSVIGCVVGLLISINNTGSSFFGICRRSERQYCTYPYASSVSTPVLVSQYSLRSTPKCYYWTIILFQVFTVYQEFLRDINVTGSDWIEGAMKFTNNHVTVVFWNIRCSWSPNYFFIL